MTDSLKKLSNLLRAIEGASLPWWNEQQQSNKIIHLSRFFSCSVELNRSIWPIRERSVCSAHNDARGLLLPVPGWAKDEQDTESVIKRDKAGSRTSLSPHRPFYPFFTDSFTSRPHHSSCLCVLLAESHLQRSSTSSSDFPSTFPSTNSPLPFIKSVIMPLSYLSSPRSQCYWLHYANVDQPRAQSYSADEIRHQHARARKKRKKKSFCFG